VWCGLSVTAAAETADVKEPPHKAECTSCKVISDGACFAIVGYLLYNAYKCPPSLPRRQRIQLYIGNGLLSAG